MEKELRRNRNTLVILGAGIIAFGLWNAVKLVLFCALETDKLLELIGDVPEDVPVMPVVFIIVGILMLIDLSLRIYVGRSARAVGLGKKRKRAYLVLAGLMAAGSLASMIYFVTGFSMDQYDSILDAAVTFLVELTSFILLAELLAAAFRIRKLTRALEEED